jgi:cytochrome c biogenesis protein CcmG/thiol:disulfide interchange protein DsbE
MIRIEQVAAAVVLLALVGCSGGGGVATGLAAEVDGGETARDSGVAPDFELADLDGRTIRLADSAGKVRLIDFWATWCAPCREEVPMLNELHATFAPRGFEILAISDETADVIQEFVSEYGVRYKNLVGTVDVVESYGVLGLPTAYLLDSEGRIVESFLGPKPRRALTRSIEALLEVAGETS